MKTAYKSLYSIILLIMLMGVVAPSLKAQSHFNTNGELQRPSTDSWNMIKYGEVGANLYTGTVQLNIPFYEYKDNDFTIPLNFRYSSNGCQPNLKAGVMGPGWTLDAGGMIGVDIQGLPDNISKNGIKSFTDMNERVTTLPSSTQLWRFATSNITKLTIGCFPTGMVYCTAGSISSSSPSYDASPDIYHFNFMGYSGTFHLGLGKKIYVYNTSTNNQDFRVSYNDLGSKYFLLETADGYKYKFSTKELLYGLGDDDTKQYVTWMLNSITAPNGRTVKFKYEGVDICYCEPASFNLDGDFFDCPEPLLNQPFNPDPHPNADLQKEHAILAKTITKQLLKSITISNGPTITFNYTQQALNQSDEFGENTSAALNTSSADKSSWRLAGIEIKSKSNTLKQCTLNYVTNNSGKRVNYLGSITISGDGTYSFDYHSLQQDAVSFPGNGTLSIDHWGYYNGKNNNNSQLPFLKICTEDPVTHNESVTKNYREPNAAYAIFGMLKKITYPTGGYTTLEYEPHTYSKAFARKHSNSFTGAITDSTGTCGGLRIKRINNYNNANILSSSRSYEYTRGGQSSGTLLYYPRYFINYSATASTSTSGLSEQNIRYYSSSITSYNSTPIEYTDVLERRDDGSCISYNFSNSLTSDKYKDYVLIGNITDEPTLGYGLWSRTPSCITSIAAPVTSRQAERGRLLERKVFKSLSAQSPEKSESYSYDTGRQLAKDNVPVYLIRKMGFTEVYVDNYRLTNKSTMEKRNGTSVANGEKISYNAQGQITRQASHLGSGDSLITKTVYVYDLSSSERGQVGQTMLDSNVVSLPFREEQYIKRKGSSTETLAEGRRYTYICPVESNLRIIRPSKEEVYDAITGTWKTEKLYTKYDKLGNLLEMKDNNGTPTAYLWGYNGLYPVAKVTGSTLEEVSTAINLSNIESNPITGSISFYENKLRTLSGTGKDVTTYDYLPFVGLSKINTPNGKVINYIYNTSGKLKRIEDNEGKSVEGGYYSSDNKLPNLD